MLKYLNFPSVSVNGQELRQNLIQVSYQSVQDGFTAYKIKEDYYLVKEILSFIPTEFHGYIKVIAVQTIDSRWNDYIHKDPRDYAINFVLQQGGPNVTTSFYDDDKNLIRAEVIPKWQWHYFNTQVYHAVNNITDTRIGITISLDKPSEDFLHWLESMAPSEGIEPPSLRS